MATTTLNVIFLHYIVNHPGDWLVAEGLWLCLIAVVPGLLISARALLTFPECQFRASYLWSPRRLKELFSFSGWQLFGATGALLRDQGMAVLMNRFFGPAANAASTVANHISSKTCLISSSFMGALGPAIANACGAKDYVRMRKLAFSCCKYGTALTLLLALPLAIELPLLVQYWLKTPPQYAVGLCWCVLGVTVIDQTSPRSSESLLKTGTQNLSPPCHSSVIWYSAGYSSPEISLRLPHTTRQNTSLSSTQA